MSVIGAEDFSPAGPAYSVNMVINLNKPSGMTSHQAVSRVKRALGAGKAGHTGTLDPLARGVLLVCLGEATKISRFLLNMDKTYLARVRLGIRTDTGDAQGRTVEERGFASLTAGDITKAAALFSGKIRQKPPMYSALKIGGEKLCNLARKGIEVEREERTVEIYDIHVSGVSLPFFDLTVSCSKGTYIRTLCEDIADRLGTVAHLSALERTGIGFFSINDSIGLEDVAPEALLFRDGHACSIDAALREMGEVFLGETEYLKMRNGVAIPFGNNEGSEEQFHVRLKDPSGKLFGIGLVDSYILRVERLFNL